MYPEIRKILKEIEFVLNKDLNLFQLGEIESLLFNFYNDSYFKGMNDSLSEYDEKLLEMLGIKQKV